MTDDAPFDVPKTEPFISRRVKDLPYTGRAFAGWVDEHVKKAIYGEIGKVHAAQVRFSLDAAGDILIAVLRERP